MARPEVGSACSWRTLVLLLTLLMRRIEGVLGEPGRAPPVSIPQVTVLGQSVPPPSVGYPIFVQADGTISLPLIQPMDVKGKSAKQVEDMIKETYVSQNIMVKGKERVFVSIGGVLGCGWTVWCVQRPN